MAAVTGTWGDVFGAAPPELQAVAVAVRGVIMALHPGVVEVARPGDRAVSFGFGPRKMTDSYAYLMPQRTWINLGFYRGATLDDSLGLLEGTGKALRHVKLRDVKLQGDVPEGVADLLRQAIGLTG